MPRIPQAGPFVGVGDRRAALPAGVCRAGGRLGVHGVGAVRVCLPPLALPPTPRDSRGWSSYPPRGPFGVDRHALVPDPHSGVRALVSLLGHAAPSILCSRRGGLAGGFRLVWPGPPQPSPLGPEEPVAAHAASLSPHPSPLSRVQLRSDDAAVGQRVWHSLSKTGACATG